VPPTPKTKHAPKPPPKVIRHPAQPPAKPAARAAPAKASLQRRASTIVAPAKAKRQPTHKLKPHPTLKVGKDAPAHIATYPGHTGGGNWSPGEIEQIYVSTGEQVGASELGILGALCAGYGETPNFDIGDCNHNPQCGSCGGGCCGVWQLDCHWQSLHDFRDVPYWTKYAYEQGFYSHGGLKHIADANPNLDPGWIAQLCQGAGPTDSAAAAYYEQFAGRARATYARLKGKGAPGGQVLYVNPWHDATVNPSRIDQGVDYGGTGYFSAFAACVVTRYWGSNSGWGGPFLEYQITQDGPTRGDYFYIAEGITPACRVGQHIPAGGHLAKLNPGGGIECGQSSGNGTDVSWARAYGGGWTQQRDNDNWASHAGIAFSNLIAALGGKPGIVDNPQNTYGLWPRWITRGVVPSQITSNAGQPGASYGQTFGGGGPAGGQSIATSSDAVAQTLSLGPFIEHDWWLFHVGTTKGHDSAAAAQQHVAKFDFLTTKHSKF
jgi:hypothetical protein